MMNNRQLADTFNLIEIFVRLKARSFTSILAYRKAA